MQTTHPPTGFAPRFDELTRRWNAHQDLRRNGASVAELARSRQALDTARDQIRYHLAVG